MKELELFEYTTGEDMGEEGAFLKAKELVYEQGYKVLSIEHTLVLKQGFSLFPSVEQKVPGYLIVADPNGFASYERRHVPTEIIEKIR